MQWRYQLYRPFVGFGNHLQVATSKLPAAICGVQDDMTRSHMVTKITSIVFEKMTCVWIRVRHCFRSCPAMCVVHCGVASGAAPRPSIFIQVSSAATVHRPTLACSRVTERCTKHLLSPHAFRWPRPIILLRFDHRVFVHRFPLPQESGPTLGTLCHTCISSKVGVVQVSWQLIMFIEGEFKGSLDLCFTLFHYVSLCCCCCFHLQSWLIIQFLVKSKSLHFFDEFIICSKSKSIIFPFILYPYGWGYPIKNFPLYPFHSIPIVASYESHSLH